MLREMLEIVCDKNVETKHKFGGAKVSKAEQVRKYFVNPKI